MKRLIPLLGVVGAIALAAPAHANPDTFFLDCLANRGYTIYDPSAAVSWGSRIEQDEVNNIPIVTIERNLVIQGFSVVKADDYIHCAALTYLS